MHWEESNFRGEGSEWAEEGIKGIFSPSSQAQWYGLCTIFLNKFLWNYSLHFTGVVWCNIHTTPYNKIGWLIQDPEGRRFNLLTLSPTRHWKQAMEDKNLPPPPILAAWNTRNFNGSSHQNLILSSLAVSNYMSGLGVSLSNFIPPLLQGVQGNVWSSPNFILITILWGRLAWDTEWPVVYKSLVTE